MSQLILDDQLDVSEVFSPIRKWITSCKITPVAVYAMSRSSGEPNASLSYSSARSQRYGSEFCMVTPEYLNAQQSRKLPVYTGLKPLHNYCMRRLGVVPAAGLLLITI